MTHVFMLTIDSNATLRECWDKLADGLRSRGAGESQLEVMQEAFFLGAVHVYSRLDCHVDSSESYFNTMNALLEEITGARSLETAEVQGHA